METDLHLVAYDVLMDYSSTEFLHHFSAYICDNDETSNIKNVSNLSYECGPGGDEDIEKSLLKGACDLRTLMFTWVKIKKYKSEKILILF